MFELLAAAPDFFLGSGTGLEEAAVQVILDTAGDACAADPDLFRAETTVLTVRRRQACCKSFGPASVVVQAGWPPLLAPMSLAEQPRLHSSAWCSATGYRCIDHALDCASSLPCCPALQAILRTPEACTPKVLTLIERTIKAPAADKADGANLILDCFASVIESLPDSCEVGSERQCGLQSQGGHCGGAGISVQEPVWPALMWLTRRPVAHGTRVC